jgi:hypothetical protein
LTRGNAERKAARRCCLESRGSVRSSTAARRPSVAATVVCRTSMATPSRTVRSSRPTASRREGEEGCIPLPKSAQDDVPALLCRWWAGPEDGQVEVGGAVGVSPGDRAFDGYNCHVGVGMIVRGDLLRQGITPETFFLHQKPPDDLLSSAHTLAPWIHGRISRATYFCLSLLGQEIALRCSIT